MSGSISSPEASLRRWPTPLAPGALALPRALQGALLGCLGAFSLSPALYGAVQAEAVDSESPPAIRLVVMVSVDQLIPQQLERLAPVLTGGLGRLVQEGARYRDARLPYARTETGAGHVTFSTGCLPRTHGVVGNSFYDRALSRDVYCVEDVDAYAIQTTGKVEGTGRRSPINLTRPTLGEILQSKNAATRVVSISAKDRAAIGMAGRSDGLVLWWDKNGSGFQTSNFYGDALPSYVIDWNKGWLPSYRGWTWNPIEERSDQEFERLGTTPDGRVGETPLGEMGITFPYAFPREASPKTMGGLAYQSPLGDQFVVEMAREAIRQESLGADDDVDLLCVSFSSCDVVGHANGPYSREVTDLLLRLDRDLGLLFADLDQSVGKGRWMLALTSDHGVLPLPEYLQARGVEARRVTKEEVSSFGRDLFGSLQRKVGARVRFKNVAGGFRLDRADMAMAMLEPVSVRAAAAEVVRELAATHTWIETAYSYEELAALGEFALGTEAQLRNSFHPDRAPDVALVQRIHVLKAMQLGTSHGSPYDYDRHVPMLFYGPDFPAGNSSRPVGSQDIAPTLLGALGISLEGLDFDGVNLNAGD